MIGAALGALNILSAVSGMAGGGAVCGIPGMGGAGGAQGKALQLLFGGTNDLSQKILSQIFSGLGFNSQ